MKTIIREFLLSFWKVHILHHAGEGPVYGQWMLSELRRHGYDISPGTLYPLLQRMEQYGWLRCETDPRGGQKSRKNYFLTKEGRKVLETVREQVREMYREVVVERGKKER
jgi:DNA-binding PadR family transcriptional regulator